MINADVYMPSTNQVTTSLDMSVTSGFCYGETGSGCNGLLHPTGEVDFSARPIFGCDVCGRRFVRAPEQVDRQAATSFGSYKTDLCIGRGRCGKYFIEPSPDCWDRETHEEYAARLARDTK